MAAKDTIPAMVAEVASMGAHIAQIDANQTQMLDAIYALQTSLKAGHTLPGALDGEGPTGTLDPTMGSIQAEWELDAANRSDPPALPPPGVLDREGPTGTLDPTMGSIEAEWELDAANRSAPPALPPSADEPASMSRKPWCALSEASVRPRESICEDSSRFAEESSRWFFRPKPTCGKRGPDRGRLRSGSFTASPSAKSSCEARASRCRLSERLSNELHRRMSPSKSSSHGRTLQEASEYRKSTHQIHALDNARAFNDFSVQDASDVDALIKMIKAKAKVQVKRTCRPSTCQHQHVHASKALLTGIASTGMVAGRVAGNLRPSRMVSPTSRNRLLWDAGTLAFTLFSCFLNPIQWAWPSSFTAHLNVWIFIDLMRALT